MYSSWLDLLQSHFFPAYYIPTLEEDAHASTSFSIHSDYVFNRGIFKDVLGSTLIYPDYQYRCNQVVAISIAPFLFPKSYTTKVLQKIIQDLYGPSQLGLKTLSQNDMAYRPRYINQDNIGDASVNNGQNYHNGPEWVWPVGHLLQALTYFPPEDEKSISSSLLLLLQVF